MPTLISVSIGGAAYLYLEPRYRMEFHNFRPFEDKQIAQAFIDHPEPGKELVGKVAVLVAERSLSAIVVFALLRWAHSEWKRSPQMSLLSTGQPFAPAIRADTWQRMSQ